MKSLWTQSQRERADILFKEYPDIKKAYYLAMRLGLIIINVDLRMSLLQDLQDSMMKWINQDSLHLGEWQYLFKHTILISSTSLIEDLQLPRLSLSMLKLKHLEHNSGEVKIKHSFYTELVCYMHKKRNPSTFYVDPHFVLCIHLHLIS